MIYFDNASTTCLSEKVKENIISILDNFGNPSNLYKLGFQTKKVIENSRKQVAKAINANNDEIFFTSGASESNNWILNNFKNIYSSNIEHSSIHNYNKYNEYDFTKEFDYSKINDKSLFCLMLVNNETGSIQNIKEICKKIHEHKGLFLCDATQAIGNINVDVKKLGIDFLSFSGHKFHAPKGIGVLYIKKDIQKYIKPLIYGGKQENGFRGGTENIIGISAIGIAIEEAVKNIQLRQDHCKKLKDYTIKLLKENNIDFIINGENTIDSILNISIKGIDSESFINYLDINDIYVSSGSACESGELKNSYVLNVIGTDKNYINGTIRLSFDLYNTFKDIEMFCESTKKYISLI